MGGGENQCLTIRIVFGVRSVLGAGGVKATEESSSIRD